MIGFQSAALRRGNKLLFQDASLTVHQSEKIGLIGANGCGKSSLFRLLLGNLSLDEGQITLPPSISISATQQDVVDLNATILDYVLDGDKELRHWQNIYQQAVKSDDTNLISKATDELDRQQAWNADTRAKQLLAGLGFSEQQLPETVGTFSGGWQMRLNLARALMQPSDLLLLDEPTNHLDLDAILWLESWLKNYSGTLLLISHDRVFLDSLVSRVIHFNQQRLSIYTGNYSAFEKQLAETIRLQQAQQQRIADKQKHLEQFINRFRAKATKAKQVQSRVKTLNKMQTIAITQTQSPYRFKFHEPDAMPNPMARLDAVSIGYNESLADNINLILQPGDRLGVLGHNGAGKSTLLKTLVGALPALTGDCWISKNTDIGYFDQHQMDSLDPNLSAFDIAQNSFPEATTQMVLDFLGGFGFTGEDAQKESRHLSGGERSRLLLAMIMREKPNLLILDEPTNHLDIQARESLNLALQTYSGAIILVSHDRHLLETTCEQFLIVDNGRMTSFDGSMDDYAKMQLQSEPSQTAPKAKSETKKLQRQQAAQKRQALAPVTKKLNLVERKMQSTQKQLDEIEQQLADPSIYQAEAKQDLKACLLQQADMKNTMADLEMEYLELLEQIERLEQEL